MASSPGKEILEKYRALAKHCCQQYRSQEYAFNLICQEFKYEKLHPNEIVNLFRRYAKDPDFCNDKEVKRDVYTVVETVFNEYQKFKHGIALCDDGVLNLLDSRYAFGIQEDGNGRVISVVIYDIFQDQKRILSLNQRVTCGRYHIEPIDMEYCLLFAQFFKYDLDDRSVVYLIKMDIPNCKCTIVGQKKYRGCFFKVCKDTDDSRKFGVMLLTDHDSYDLQFGKVNGSRLEFGDDEYRSYELYSFGCYKLTSNSIYAFGKCSAHSTVGAVKFCKFSFGTNGTIQSETLFNGSSIVKCEFSPMTSRKTEYTWCGSVCYFTEHCYADAYIIGGYDTEKRNLFTIRIQRIKHLKQLHFDDGILTVFREYADKIVYEKGQIYRFPFGKPDKLENLALFKIRQQSMFYGKDKYDHIQLPANLKAFNFLPQIEPEKPAKKPKPQKTSVVPRQPLRQSQRLQSKNADQTPAEKRSKKS